jgi:hypothetical protein
MTESWAEITNWNEILFREFQEARLSPGWKTIYDNHDEQDQAYWGTLEKLYQAKKLKVKRWDL